MAPPTRSHKEYLVAWICALPLEMAAAKAMLDETHSPLSQPPADHNTYTLGSMGDHAVVIACLPYGVYGTTSAATMFGLMVGIGGGVPSKHADIRLGDVVVSKPSATSGGVIQYDYGKTVHGGRIERTGSLNKPHPTLLTAMANIESNRILGKDPIIGIVHDIVKMDEEAQKRFRQPEHDWLFDAAYSHEGHNSDCVACDQSQLIPREARVTDGPTIHYGLIASGNQVMKDGKTRDRIAAPQGILCFEMEAAGLMDQLPYLVIRGICDYCDSHKNKHWQGYAALTAAAYARNLLSAVSGITSMRDVEARKRVWMVPFPRNPRFVGRQDQMTRLENLMSMSYGPMKIALTGLGGMGKTQIALELAYRMRDGDDKCSVFWIPSVSQESVEQAYMSIAQHLRLPDANPADVKMRVQSYLSHERAGRWLLICDNADDMDMWVSRDRTTPLTALSAFLPQSDHGCILFTTRNRKLAQKLAPSHVIPLHEVDEETAKEILMQSLLRPELLSETTIKITALLRQLTFLPLAITQAAAYINANGIELSDYIELLQEQEHDVIELLSEDFEDEGRYAETQNPVATTWLVSFNQIQRLDSLAADYLSFMACIDPRNIPQSLLPHATSQKRKIDALGLLNAYSFTTSQSDGSLILHRLVHLATRSWLRKNALLHTSARRAADSLEEVFPDDDHQNRSLWRKYLPHALFLMQQHNLRDVTGGYIDLMERIGACLYSDGRYNEAEVFFRDTLHIHQGKNGKNHPSTLVSMANLASTYRNQGRWDEAEKLEVQVMEKSMTVRGAEHPNTLNSMMNLASTYWNQGRWNEAEKLEVQVMEKSMTVRGAEHPNTLNSMMNLASTYWNQGRWNEAEKLEVQVMEKSMTLLGAEHPDTLTSMMNLASTYQSQGRWNEAEKLEVQVMEISTTVLGAEHPDTLTSIANLASTYRNQGRWNEAEKLGVQVIETSTAVLGAEHPDTLIRMGNLASTYRNQGRWNEAEKLGVQVIETSTTVLGAEHPTTLTSMANLASTYQSQGRWNEAEKLDMQVMEISITVLGAEHPDTLASIANMASTYRNQGRWNEAEKLEAQVMEKSMSVLGAEHPSTLTSMTILAFTWKDIGKQQDAILLMSQCIQLCRKYLGPDHPNTISSIRALNEWQSMDITSSNNCSESMRPPKGKSQSPSRIIPSEAQSQPPSLPTRQRKREIFSRLLGKF
ncbi:hypothetical protein TMatcc_009078 [Talaromyces marneffei ATCC 18224]